MKIECNIEHPKAAGHVGTNGDEFIGITYYQLRQRRERLLGKIELLSELKNGLTWIPFELARDNPNESVSDGLMLKLNDSLKTYEHDILLELAPIENRIHKTRKGAR